MSTLSERGRKSYRPMAEYLVKSFEAWKDEYHPKTNPNGFVNLSVAENLLSLPDVAAELSNAPPVPPENLTYGNPEHFTSVIASFLEKHILLRPVNPKHVSVMNGGTSVLDTFATVLCDAGDKVLLTGPGYRGLELDVGGRANADVVAACLEGEGDDEHDPVITVQALEKAWLKEGGRDSRIRMAIICSPNNPTGEVLSREVIMEIAQWAIQRKVHVIFDEVYARSVYSETAKFVSVLDVMDDKLGDYVHITWSFSKDLCISGCRVGIMYSQNPELMRSVSAFLAFFSMTSRHTQWALEHLVTNDKWLEDYFEKNRIRLAGAYKRVTGILESMDIPYMKAEAGFFVWVDLRKWMNGNTAEAEMELWKRILDTKVLLTPSSQSFARRFGYFRVCFAAVEPDALELGWKRMATVLNSIAN